MIVTSGKLRTMRLLYARGDSYAGIAGIVGVSKDTVRYWARKRPDLFPPREVRDEAWWREKLPEVEGWPAAAAARRLGCHRHTVWKWRRLIDGTR